MAPCTRASGISSETSDGYRCEAVLSPIWPDGCSLSPDPRNPQTYIELNATAFRKICKKWDKACRRQADRFGDTRPQEGQPDGQLYLARQVEVQPVFNREFIAQLSDVASANLLSLENLLGGDGQRTGSAALADGSSIDGTTHSAPHLPTLFDRADRAEALEDLETALVSAVKAGEQAIVDEVLGLLLPSTRAPAAEPKGPVARILWRAALEEPTPATATTHATQDGGSEPKAAKPAIPQDLLDFAFVDDINGRTTLHESASAGRLPLVVACLERGLSVAQADVYGRQPLHYAAMNGHAAVCRMLLDAGASPSTADLDGYSPIIYSITNGWTAVVETFLAAGVSFDEPAEAPSGASSADQLNALSLASQYGHEAIARLLLERGAKVLPNPAGYWPQHLAAREGHAGVLSLLVEAIKAQGAPAEGGIDAPDKYSQATPLLHAASEGHVDSVRVLLAAGAAVHAVDEFKRTPVHYAAWQGHIDCVNLLIDAGATIPPQSSQPMDHDVDEAGQATASVSTTDMAPPDLDDLDGDAIPDLSLPPPIIPFRVYGHSYIDEKRLVQVTLGHPNTARAPFPPPIRLYDQPNHGHAPSLKLVITPKPDSSGTSIPHSVILPLADEREVFSFQVDTLADFSLEFDLFPTFGSKMIGKAVAAPSTFADLQSQGSYVVPVIDPHLKVIGDIPFEINVVKPFGRAQLQIGGQFETYWKSTATLQTTAAPGDHGATPATSSVVTASSLSGEHVRIVVQVTADGHPVAYPLWRLPVDGFDISVGDVRLDQFSALAKRLGKSVDPAQVNDREDPSAWYHAIADALVPLEELLSVRPTISPSPSVDARQCSSSGLPSFADPARLARRQPRAALPDPVRRAAPVAQPHARGQRLCRLRPLDCLQVDQVFPSLVVVVVTQRRRLDPGTSAHRPVVVQPRRLHGPQLEAAQLQRLLCVVLWPVSLGERSRRRRRGRRWPAGQACPRQPRRGRPAVHEHPRGGQVCQSQQPPRHHARGDHARASSLRSFFPSPSPWRWRWR